MSKLSKLYYKLKYRGIKKDLDSPEFKEKLRKEL